MDRPDSDNATGLGEVLVGRVLAHHGIKGMKWGVRKKTASHPASEDHATVQAHTKKVKEGGVKSLSNKELQDIITRKNLEKQHRELTSGGRSFDKGHKHIKKVLSVFKTIDEVQKAVDTTTGAVKKVRGH